MKKTLSTILPAAMICVSAALMIWDIHNQRIIVAAGMAWDSGPPLWPYQTPNILILALNAPAWFVTIPISYFLGVAFPASYWLLFPAITCWWWLVSWYLQKRSRGLAVKRSALRLYALSILALVLIALSVNELFSTVSWWWIYSRTLLSVTDLILLRSITPSIWCFAIAFVALKSAWKQFQLRSSTPFTKP